MMVSLVLPRCYVILAACSLQVRAVSSPIPQACPTPTSCEIPTYTPLTPRFAPTYQMNRSTIAMPCSVSGFSNASFLGRFGVVDYDWSNAKDEWSKAKPMDCQERLVTQAKMTKAAHPEAKVWVYRNFVKALPWFTDVRVKINDPAYAGWFLHLNNSSELYHDTQQTRSGDCGGITCGEYLWDHRNQSLRHFLVDTVAAGPNGVGNPNIDGLFIDDFWSNFPYHLPWATNPISDCSLSTYGGPSEIKGGCIGAMGLSPSDIEDIAKNWLATMQAVFAKVVSMNGYVWQMLQFPDGPNDSPTLPRTAAFFRRECQPNSTSATSPINLRFSNAKALDPVTGAPTLPQFEQDLAAFLLIRSEYAWLGYSWGGCDRKYTLPPMLDADFGEPTEICKETAVNSGVFTRDWTKATVTLDTNTNKAAIVLKK